jgi:hypothetical protein
MKRYWLFGGNSYYPNGGMGDFRGSFDSREEAIEVGAAIREGSDSWYHVFDSQENEIAKERETVRGFDNKWHTDLRVEE